MRIWSSAQANCVDLWHRSPKVRPSTLQWQIFDSCGGLRIVYSDDEPMHKFWRSVMIAQQATIGFLWNHSLEIEWYWRDRIRAMHTHRKKRPYSLHAIQCITSWLPAQFENLLICFKIKIFIESKEERRTFWNKNQARAIQLTRICLLEMPCR